jgi:hypothetical protein
MWGSRLSKKFLEEAQRSHHFIMSSIQGNKSWKLCEYRPVVGVWRVFSNEIHVDVLLCQLCFSRKINDYAESWPNMV